MALLENTMAFLAATALTLLAWLVYLWANNMICRSPIPFLKEVLGAILSCSLFAALGLILYFFAIPLAMGAITVSILLAIVYIVRKSLFRNISTNN